jgi:NRPS condensation-like uncharacterized protein
VLVVKDIVEAYLACDDSAVAQPFDLYPPRKDRLFDHGLGLLWKKLARLPKFARNMNVSNRHPFSDPLDFNSGFTFFSEGEPSLRALTAAAKVWSVTINDLFLAILPKCLSPLAEDRWRNPVRQSVSLGCIVNLRREVALANPRTFGLLLGSFSVTHSVPARISLADLARDVSFQTRTIKSERLYVGMPIELMIGRILLSVFSKKRRQKLQQKSYPLWGGVTNMNLNALWPEFRDHPVNYFRAVSTGPATPLVLSVTTAGEFLNIGVSYRKTVFSEDQIKQIKNDFLHLLGQLHNLV